MLSKKQESDIRKNYARLKKAGRENVSIRVLLAEIDRLRRLLKRKKRCKRIPKADSHAAFFEDGSGTT